MTFPRSILVLTLIACLVGASGAGAATDRWEPYPPGVGGPWGGNVRRLVTPDPDTGVLWAATAGGVYHSTDGGDHWVSRSVGLESYDVTDIGVCAADPTVLIASTDDRGVHLSTDGGATWSRVPASAMAGYPTDFTRVAVDPGDCTRMFAASYNGPDKLYRSTDGGVTWDDLGENPVSRLVFASRPAVGAWELFFSTRNGKVFRFGPDDTWPLWIHTFPSGSPVTELALPGGDGTVFVAAQGGDGLWVSTDGGASWEERHFKGSPNSEFLEVDAVAADPLNSQRLVYHVNDPFTGTQTALYDSPDLGVTATPETLPESEMDLSFVSIVGGVQWLSESKAGLFRSIPSSPGFEPATDGLGIVSVRDVAFGPTGLSLAVVGGGFSAAGRPGVHLWDEVTSAWVRKSDGLPPGSTTLARWSGSDLWVAVEGWGLYRTPDGGETWEERDIGLSDSIRNSLSDLVFSAGDPDVAVLGTGGGVYQTADAGGQTQWSISAEIPATFGWGLEPDPFGGATGYYAGGKDFGPGGALFATADPAAGWGELGDGAFAADHILSISVSPTLPGHLLVGTRSSGVLESFDAGSSWTSLSDGFNGLPTAGIVSQVRFGHYDALAAAVIDNGVYATVDGVTWSKVEQGLLEPEGTVPVVLSLVFEPVGRRLVVGLHNRGLRYLDLVDLAAPRFSVRPAPGVYAGAQIVTIFANEPAMLYYTVDGAEPTTASPSAMAPVSVAVNASATLRVFGEDGLGNRSDVADHTYVIDTVAPVVSASPPGGEYASDQVVTLAADEPATIYYTTDGTTPTTTSSSGPAPVIVDVSTSLTLRFFGVDVVGNVSSPGAEDYTLASPGGGGGGSGGGGGGGCFLQSLGGLHR